jgi:hypothetical protein
MEMLSIVLSINSLAGRQASAFSTTLNTRSMKMSGRSNGAVSMHSEATAAQPIGVTLARPLSLEELEGVSGGVKKTKIASAGGNSNGDWNVDVGADW